MKEYPFSGILPFIRNILMVIFGQPYGGSNNGSTTPPDVSDQIAAYIAAHPFYRTFKSWAELKAAKPTATGERVFLSSYNAVTDGSFHGSGWFTGSLAGKIADDGVYTLLIAVRLISGCVRKNTTS